MVCGKETGRLEQIVVVAITVRLQDIRKLGKVDFGLSRHSAVVWNVACCLSVSILYGLYSSQELLLSLPMRGNALSIACFA